MYTAIYILFRNWQKLFDWMGVTFEKKKMCLERFLGWLVGTLHLLGPLHSPGRSTLHCKTLHLHTALYTALCIAHWAAMHSTVHRNALNCTTLVHCTLQTTRCTILLFTTQRCTEYTHAYKQSGFLAQRCTAKHTNIWKSAFPDVTNWQQARLHCGVY